MFLLNTRHSAPPGPYKRATEYQSEVPQLLKVTAAPTQRTSIVAARARLSSIRPAASFVARRNAKPLGFSLDSRALIQQEIDDHSRRSARLQQAAIWPLQERPECRSVRNQVV